MNSSSACLCGLLRLIIFSRRIPAAELLNQIVCVWGGGDLFNLRAVMTLTVCSYGSRGLDVCSIKHLLYPEYRSVLSYPCPDTVPETSQGGRMSRGSASCSRRSGYPNLAGSSLEPADSNPGLVKPMTLKLILVAGAWDY